MSEKKSYNIETLYNTQNSVIKLFDDYSTIASEAKYELIHGKDSKYYLQNKCFIPVVLAQIKTGNLSENLLNKICQIVYFLYLAKEITKKSLFINSENSKNSDAHCQCLILQIK